MERSLTNYQLKLLAALFMAVDHVGYVFFPDMPLFRIIGRLSFPLFCWLLVQGEHHTRNVWRYGVRLLILGIVSQPFYVWTFGSQNEFNILFTLLIGLVCLRGGRQYPQLAYPFWFTGAAIAQFANVDYGLYGIALIWLISQFKFDQMWWWASWFGAHIMLVAASPSYGLFQIPAVFSSLFFGMASDQRGAKARWFYLFYPLHLLIISLVRMAIAAQ